MCAHPYDYAGPVVGGQCTSCAFPGGRAGSILDLSTVPAVADAQVQPAAAVVDPMAQPVDPVTSAQPAVSGAAGVPVRGVVAQPDAAAVVPVASVGTALAPEVPQGGWTLRGGRTR